MAVARRPRPRPGRFGQSAEAVAGAPPLYTPQILGLATGLSAYPWDDGLPLKTSVRSRTCGSSVELGLKLDAADRIDRIGLKTQACAIGQAAAAIFAAAAPGRKAGDIIATETALADWLAGNGPEPTWPGIGALASARDYPARHAAILLAWQAARELLSSRGRTG